MAKLTPPSKITQADFPQKSDAGFSGFTPKFIQNFATYIRDLYNALNGNLTISDNLSGAELILSLAHGVPHLIKSPLRSGVVPISAIAIGCDTQPFPSLSLNTSATVNGTFTTAPAGYIFVTALYPVPITDWISYTLTGGWTTNSTYTGKWRRVGDTMEVRINVSLSGAPNAAFLQGFSFPNGLSIDSSKLLSTPNGTQIGDGTSLSNATGLWDILALWTSGNNILLQVITSVGGASGINATTPATYKSGDYVNVFFRVPIVGWGITGTTANVTIWFPG